MKLSNREKLLRLAADELWGLISEGRRQDVHPIDAVGHVIDTHLSAYLDDSDDDVYEEQYRAFESLLFGYMSLTEAERNVLYLWRDRPTGWRQLLV